MYLSLRSLKRSFARSTGMKIGVGFLLGAFVVGGVATAVTSTTVAVKACVDNRTQAMYLSTDGTCSKRRTLVDLGTGGMNVKAIAAAVTPSVVSVNVTSASGSGTGSGSIIRTSASSSYILTNNHVVESAATSGTITVEFNNGDTIGATIVGRDTTYDLAVIQIMKGNLPVISFGDSSALVSVIRLLLLVRHWGLQARSQVELFPRLIAPSRRAASVLSHILMRSD